MRYIFALPWFLVRLLVGLALICIMPSLDAAEIITPSGARLVLLTPLCEGGNYIFAGGASVPVPGPVRKYALVNADGVVLAVGCWALDHQTVILQNPNPNGPLTHIPQKRFQP